MAIAQQYDHCRRRVDSRIQVQLEVGVTMSHLVYLFSLVSLASSVIIRENDPISGLGN